MILLAHAMEFAHAHANGTTQTRFMKRVCACNCCVCNVHEHECACVRARKIKLTLFFDSFRHPFSIPRTALTSSLATLYRSYYPTPTSPIISLFSLPPTIFFRHSPTSPIFPSAISPSFLPRSLNRYPYLPFPFATIIVCLSLLLHYGPEQPDFQAIIICFFFIFFY